MVGDGGAAIVEVHSLDTSGIDSSGITAYDPAVPSVSPSAHLAVCSAAVKPVAATTCPDCDLLLETGGAWRCGRCERILCDVCVSVVLLHELRDGCASRHAAVYIPEEGGCLPRNRKFLVLCDARRCQLSLKKFNKRNRGCWRASLDKNRP